MSQTPFFFATLEEYYTGALFLPVGNGITDGSVVLIGINVIAGVWGCEIFTQSVSILGFETTLNILCFGFATMTQIFGSLGNLNEIVKAYFRPIKEGEYFREQVNFLTLLKQTIAFLSSVLAYFLFASKFKQMLTPGNSLVLCLGFSWCSVHFAMRVMLAHLTRQKLPATNWIYWAHLGFIVCALAFKLGLWIERASFLVIGFLGLCQAHFVVGLVFELSQALEIRVFRTKPLLAKKTT